MPNIALGSAREEARNSGILDLRLSSKEYDRADDSHTDRENSLADAEVLLGAAENNSVSHIDLRAKQFWRILT